MSLSGSALMKQVELTHHSLVFASDGCQSQFLVFFCHKVKVIFKMPYLSECWVPEKVTVYAILTRLSTFKTCNNKWGLIFFHLGAYIRA